MNSDDKRIRVSIVDDQSMVRKGLKLIIGTYEDLLWVGEAEDGEQAYAMALESRPHVILMDIRMPRKDGLTATSDILNDPRLSGVAVIVLTTFDLDEYVYSALSLGASGFLLKDTEPDDLHRAIVTVARGDALIQPSITRRLIGNFSSRNREKGLESSTLLRLSEREKQILILVARGFSNEQIAAELGISPATARTHVGNVMSKLGCHDRVQLVITAYETGLVKAGQ